MKESINIKIENSLSITLTIVFFILKKCNVIDWSWIWVFSPLWISAILTIIIFGITLLFSIGTSKDFKFKGKDEYKNFK